MRRNLIILALILLCVTSVFSLNLKEKLEAYLDQSINLHLKDALIATRFSGSGSDSGVSDINYTIMLVGTLTEVGDGYVVIYGKRWIYKGNSYLRPESSTSDQVIESVNRYFIVPMDQIIYFDSTDNLN
jgi:hypothetical protein